MVIQPGVRLGPYEVVALLGTGGMGEVYKARDTRLNRLVALKVLAPHLASDPQFRERFNREARAVSQITHPHICALHDVGEQDGTAFLVMQYLEGETLARRLGKGALPVEQALQYAIEIADALDKAHRAGIVHRDLKPGNVMVTKSGAVLLDFGLAKAHGPTAGGATLEPLTAAGISALPTEENLTAQGAILGTFQYMAPEQVEGEEADPRTDLFAFGAVLYEMLTGRKAFEGRTQASLIAAILDRDPPPIATLQPLAPRPIERIVRKCLAKPRDDRWQSARDMLDELKWAAADASETSVTGSGVREQGPLTRRARPYGWMAATTVLLAITLVLGAVSYLRPGPEGARTLRFPVTLPEGWSLVLTNPNGPSPAPIAVSPDGSRIALVARNADTQTLWVHSLDSMAARQLPGTDGATQPFWSPDSRHLGFFAGSTLKKIDVGGGPPIVLSPVPGTVGGGTWSEAGVILFSTGGARGVIQKVSADGGVPVTVTNPGREDNNHLRPSALPDGRHFLYAGSRGGVTAPIYVGSLDSGTSVRLFDSGSSNVRYSQGHLLFLRGPTLMAQPFDLERLALAGDSFPVAESVLGTAGPPPLAVFSTSDNGVLAYQAGGNVGASRRLIWFDREGRRLGSLGDSAQYTDLSLSPDGRYAAVSQTAPGQAARDIWLYDLRSGFPTRFTFDAADDRSPVWSPDGRRVAFVSNRKGRGDIYQKTADGAGGEEPLLVDDTEKEPADWSRDGRFLLYRVNSSISNSIDAWILPLTGERKPFPLLQSMFNEMRSRFSPDGRWVAYQSDESGMPQVYVVRVPGSDKTDAAGAQQGVAGKRQVSVNGGVMPFWRRDGRELFFIDSRSRSRLMAASVNGEGAAFEVTGVRALGNFDLISGATQYTYNMSADGQRLLGIAFPADSVPTSPVTVVVNWKDARQRPGN